MSSPEITAIETALKNFDVICLRAAIGSEELLKKQERLGPLNEPELRIRAINQQTLRILGGDAA